MSGTSTGRSDLIVDRHSAHRSKSVRAWLADHKAEIELHSLPSYSPELNPDELVTCDFAAETRRSFQRRQLQPHVITGPHVRYTLDE